MFMRCGSGRGHPPTHFRVRLACGGTSKYMNTSRYLYMYVCIYVCMYVYMYICR